MLKVALTGGPGTGKSLALDTFKRSGIPTISSDKIVRSLQKPGSAMLESIRRNFKENLVSRRGALNRRKLRELIFSDPKSRKKLEKIVHPQTINTIKSFLNSIKKRGRDICVVEVPLLFEARLEKLFDLCITVTSPRSLQIARLRKRDLITARDATAMIGAQMPLCKKARLSDIVIRNDGTRAALIKKIKMLAKHLRKDRY